jgi:two-component system, cell cycle sensor histidine kinase and response regulator CckA
MMRASISLKLLAVTVGVISVAVALAGGVLLRQHHRELYRGFEDGAVVLARAMTEYAVGPLVLDDPPGAQEILAKLEKSSQISRAVLFDRRGQAMAFYQRRHTEGPLASLRTAPVREHLDDHLLVFEPVMHLGNQVGTLYLAASTVALRTRASEATTTVFLAGLIAIFGAALLGWLLQRNITRPILRLAETMRGIKGETMLPHRVEHVSGDEIGVLYSGFNRMLDDLIAREQERDRSTARLRALIAALPDPVFVLEDNARIAEVLAGRPEVLSTPALELRGHYIAEIVGSAIEGRLTEAVHTALATGIPQRFAYEIDRPAGRKWFDALVIPLAPDSGDRKRDRLVLFVPRDVTERHTLEVDLRQAQKMEALGRLAGGVAHDFNNILTAIMGYGSLLEGRLDRTMGPASELVEMMKAAERAAMLTQQLLAFSRRQVVAFRQVSLNELVGDMQRMLERIIGEDVQLVADLAPELPEVHFDPGQLQQVVLNLAVNAREAMPSGGTLTLSTRSVAQSARRAGEPELAPGRYVVLQVTDTGVGMDESVRARIFEPFFTTKGRKGGTGLGLAMVYGIVRQAGGDVTVASEPGKGTTFHIYLPEAAKGSEASEPEHRPTPIIARGSETLLVVEDEPQLLELASRMLAEHGYHVLVAADAHQALQICSVHPSPIHLMVTDVVMPKMGGPELVSAVRPMRPDMKVLYVSGYTDGTAIARGAAVGEIPFLQKPFTPLDLHSKVREALDDGPRLLVEPALQAPPSAPS